MSFLFLPLLNIFVNCNDRSVSSENYMLWKYEYKYFQLLKTFIYLITLNKSHLSMVCVMLLFIYCKFNINFYWWKNCVKEQNSFCRTVAVKLFITITHVLTWSFQLSERESYGSFWRVFRKWINMRRPVLSTSALEKWTPLSLYSVSSSVAVISPLHTH